MAAISTTRDVVISDRRYRITALPAIEGRRIYLKLLAHAAHPAGMFILNGIRPELVSIDAVATLAKDVQSVLGDVEDFAQAFAKCTLQLPDKPGEGDVRLDLILNTTAFQADYAGFNAWLRECLDLNYGSALKSFGLTLPQ
ncbi:MAG: hypothetical protein RL701_4527 [Pseudomonadota bacterium]|jgi:hypothetical protein